MWKIEQKNLDYKTLKSFEGMMTQGNGYISIRGSLEEEDHIDQNEVYWRMPANVTVEEKKHKEGKWGTYIPTIVGKHPILKDQMINLPYLCGLNYYVCDEKFSYKTSQVASFERTLHMDKGLLTKTFVWHVNGANISIKTDRYVHMKYKHLIIQRITLESDAHVDFGLESFVDAAVTTNGYNHFEEIMVHDKQILVKTDSGDDVVIKSELMTDFESMNTDKKIIQRCELKLEPNKQVVVHKYSSIETSKDLEACIIPKLDFQRLYLEHVSAWKDKWTDADIVIEGCQEDQLAVRFSIYHLIRAASNDDRIAIDAKGVAGEAYYGHYFWDTEIYLLPFYLMSDPSTAKNLLMFRYNTLEAAMRNSNKYGYKGAKYPWESSISGEEQCSNWQYADLEIHVGLDICFGMIKYREYTKDYGTFNDCFLPCIKQVLLYFKDRVALCGDTANLNGVMGPDEYIHFSNNNTYTNKLLTYVIEDYLHYTSDDELAFINDHLPVHDEEVILQCDDFDKFEKIDFDEVWQDRSKPFGAVVSQEKNYRSQSLKQADTLLMMYMFMHEYKDQRIKDNLDYYLPITTHDSSLSYIIHAILMAKINDPRAYEYFKKSLNLDLYSKGAEEGIHIANCGGIIQGIIYGFCGLRDLQFTDQISFNKRLPKEWHSVQFKLHYRDRSYRVTLTNENTIVDCEDS